MGYLETEYGRSVRREIVQYHRMGFVRADKLVTRNSSYVEEARLRRLTEKEVAAILVAKRLRGAGR